MRYVARYFYHLGRNALLRDYRYYRLSMGEKGPITFYDRERRKRFKVQSRGFIDSLTANQIFSNNDYSFARIGRAEEISGMYRRILDRGKIPLVVDCGANIGLSSQYFAREFPEARIVAIEPDARNIALARQNCAGFENIELHHAAIGSDAGFGAIEDETVDANAFRVSRVEMAAGITIKTIPGLLTDYPGAELFIVKVDIEGFERDLFAHNTDWIARCDVLIVELHDWLLPHQGSSGSFLRAIAGFDRDFLFRGENVYSIRNVALR